MPADARVGQVGRPRLGGGDAIRRARSSAIGVFAHPRSTTSGRVRGLAAAAAVLVTVVVGGLTPLAGASKPHLLVAPYRGTAVTQLTGLTLAGACRAGAIAQGVHWLPRSGNVTGALSAQSKSCATTPTGTGTSDAYVLDRVEVFFPVHVATSTGHNVSVSFEYNYTVLASIVAPGGCPGAPSIPGVGSSLTCSAYIEAGSSMSMQLYDATNGSNLLGGHDYSQGPEYFLYVQDASTCNGFGACAWSNSTYGCPNATAFYGHCVASGSTHNGTNTTWVNTKDNCRGTYGARCIYWDNWTLNRSHTYWVEAFIGLYATSQESYYAPGHSFLASVRGAWPGSCGWRISSVTVT
ncbi:MAG TPA: hypothetical protein VFF67_03465 [Thermoplasmata archaeon]|nr:hypothetical protein [Thermoplasmata archaeon]